VVAQRQHRLAACALEDAFALFGVNGDALELVVRNLAEQLRGVGGSSTASQKTLFLIAAYLSGALRTALSPHVRGNQSAQIDRALSRYRGKRRLEISEQTRFDRSVVQTARSPDR
jgi:hypothetical protein